MKKQKGITLIALIITIILLLILAGVVLNLTIGENGLFKTAKYAVQKNSEETAREKLELVLADLQANKYIDETYNENEYIDNYLENENMEVSGDIVTIDNWNFEIDRTIPSIKTSLGVSTVKITKEVKEYLGKNENEKYMVSVLVNIESNMKIESIEFENIDGTKLTIIPESQKISKDMQIELDKEYKVVIKIANGKVENRTIIERSIENIRTVQELVAFRDKVNSGLTYEGKTINLLADLDLSSVCGENVNGEQISWEPVANYDLDDTHTYRGTFNGNNKTISNLYINTDRYYQGLFGKNEGKVEKVTVNGKILSSGRSIGGIVGCNFGEIKKCKNNAYVEGANIVGGISGENGNIIESCCNTGEIYASIGNVGGITGFGSYYIYVCYNTGYIHGGSTAGGIVGYKYAGQNYNCYNTGEVQASNWLEE